MRDESFRYCEMKIPIPKPSVVGGHVSRFIEVQKQTLEFARVSATKRDCNCLVDFDGHDENTFSERAERHEPLIGLQHSKMKLEFMFDNRHRLDNQGSEM